MSGEFESPKLDYSGNPKQKKRIKLPKFVRLADESEQEDAFIEAQETTETIETTDATVTTDATKSEEVKVATDAVKSEEEKETTDAVKSEEEKETTDAAKSEEVKVTTDATKPAEAQEDTDEAKSVEAQEPTVETEKQEEKAAEDISDLEEQENKSAAKEPRIDDETSAEDKASEESIKKVDDEITDETAKTADKDDDYDYEVDEESDFDTESDSDYDPDPDIIIEDLDDDDELKPHIVRLKSNRRNNRRNNPSRRATQSKAERQKPKNIQIRKKPEPQKTEKNRKYKKKSDGISLLVKILLAILLIAFAAYVASVVYFMSHFSWAISAEGEEQLYNMTAEDVKTVLQNQVQDYFIAVEARDLDTIYLSGHDINMTCSFDGDIKDAIKTQNPWLWFTYRNNPSRIDLPVQIHLDEDMLAQFLDDAIYSKSGRKPTNAKFVDDPSQKAFLLQPEDNGSIIDGKKATEAISAAIKSLSDSIDLDATGVYTNAEVTAADLEKNGFYKELIGLCQTQVNVDWHGIPVVIDKEFIYPLIQNDGQKAWIDYEPVYDYVKTLSRKYDKFGQPHKFIDTEGHEINVIMGAYGWLVDRDATAKGIYDLICKGGTSSYEPVYRYEAYARGEDDIGDSYAEINITRQHMYLYVDGKVVVESDFVSGNPMKGNGTHVGIYGVTYKERDATLNGQGYSSPVSYWMPFNGNEGMHDASWRSKFGGRIYKGGGSHGCINLPVDIAGQIYEYVEKGFPVIVFTDPEDPAYQEGDDKVSEPAEEKPAEEKNDKPADTNKPLFDANSGLYYIIDPATNTPIFLDPETMQPTDVATAVNKLKALQEERVPE